MIKAAIMGYGTVGSGVYEVIKKNQVSINKKVGPDSPRTPGPESPAG